MGSVSALAADVPAIDMRDHWSELKVLNTVGTSNDLAHLNLRARPFRGGYSVGTKWHPKWAVAGKIGRGREIATVNVRRLHMTAVYS